MHLVPPGGCQLPWQESWQLSCTKSNYVLKSTSSDRQQAATASHRALRCHAKHELSQKDGRRL